MRDRSNMILPLVGLGFSCSAITSEINGNPEHHASWLIFLSLLCFAGNILYVHRSWSNHSE